MKVFRPSQDFKSCASTYFATSAFYYLIISAILNERPGGEVVTRRSAKPLCASSILARASKLFVVIEDKVDARERGEARFLF